MIMLFCSGFIPGLIFWYAYFNSKDVTYRVELRGAGRRNRVVFRGHEGAKGTVESVAKMISQAANLPYEAELGMFD